MAGLRQAAYRLAILWVCLTLSQEAVLATEPPITCLAFSPDETVLLAGSQKGVNRFAWPSLEPIAQIKVSLSNISQIAFSQDGKRFAVVGGIPGEQGTLEIWAWPECRRLLSVSPHADVIYQAVWSTDAKRLFSASHDGEVLELEPQTGEILRKFTGHSQPVRGLCFLEKKQALVSVGQDQTMRVWDANTGKQIRSLHNHTKAVIGIAPKPNEDSQPLPIVASWSEDRTVRLWQPTIGRMMRFHRLEESSPLALAWTPDGKQLVVTTQAGDLIQLDAETLAVRSRTKSQVELPQSFILTRSGQSAVVGGAKGTFRKLALLVSQ